MIICVDFDGTIAGHAYPKIGDPNIKVLNKLIQLKKEGHKLILWTCRDGIELEAAIKWCKNKGLIFDAVNENLPEIEATFIRTSRKVYADFYLDDRNLTIEKFSRWGINQSNN